LQYIIKNKAIQLKEMNKKLIFIVKDIKRVGQAIVLLEAMGK
jgi:hypothetical protein